VRWDFTCNSLLSTYRLSLASSPSNSFLVLSPVHKITVRLKSHNPRRFPICSSCVFFTLSRFSGPHPRPLPTYILTQVSCPQSRSALILWLLPLVLFAGVSSSFHLFLTLRYSYSLVVALVEAFYFSPFPSFPCLSMHADFSSRRLLCFRFSKRVRSIALFSVEDVILPV